jgi:hypothetical protein
MALLAAAARRLPRSLRLLKPHHFTTASSPPSFGESETSAPAWEPQSPVRTPPEDQFAAWVTRLRPGFTARDLADAINSEQDPDLALALSSTLTPSSLTSLILTLHTLPSVSHVLTHLHADTPLVSDSFPPQPLEHAQYNLGVMFQKGQGVAQDLQEAAAWYQLETTSSSSISLPLSSSLEPAMESSWAAIDQKVRERA